ncbi:MAG: hypothetical protein QQN61_00755 [Nitrosopumilus sp.]
MTIKILIGNVLKSKGDSVTLYLRNALSIDPNARKINYFIYMVYINNVVSAIWEK